jgi:hypothetical protein
VYGCSIVSTLAFSTKIKNGLNALLNPLGLEIGTTLKRRMELGRLKKLHSRGHWETPQYPFDFGLAIDETKCLEFLLRTCEPYKLAYAKFPWASNGHGSFHLNNGWFDSVDAELLYSVIRSTRPQQIFEVGSGFSTRLMRSAIEDGNLETRITSIDPEPRVEINSYADECIREPVEDIKAARIADCLRGGDILFIDSSHTVKTGGDVPYLFLDILPRLKPGVLIHIHDIFLPFDYPEQWVLDWGWNEQYLVHAFLAYNQTFEILWPARYMWEHHRSEIERLIPITQTCTPSSLWLKKEH